MPTTADVEELAAIAMEYGRRSLVGFTAFTFEEYQPNWHHRVVGRYLDAVLAGTLRRLMIFMPPQNGKSESVSRRFPAYALGRQPDLRIIASSYSAALATDMSRDVQKIIDTRAYRTLFPDTRLATASDPEMRTAAQFDVVGRRGYYMGAGVGGSITGRSADIGIIDDPIKNRAEAESETYRKNVWDWFVSTFSTRQFGATGRMVLALTRWHEDDLAGRLLRLAREDPRADQWTVVSFPAIADGVLHPDDPRQPGEALWPSHYPIAELESRRVGMGTYDWSALYQQQPAPPGGGLFQQGWFKTGALPAGVALRYCRAWDCAGTEATSGRDPDYTVGTLLASTPTKQYVVVDVVRVRLSAGAVDALMLETAKTDPPGTLIREERELGSAGKAVIAAHTRLLAGYDYQGVPATGDKVTRWRPFAVQAEAGNVSLVPSDVWRRAWIDEMALAPYGRHDDQADSVALAFNSLTIGPGPIQVTRLSGF